MPPLLLGLDLGTTNAKAAAWDLDGRCHAAAETGYPTHFPRPGWAEQHPPDWTEALSKAVCGTVARLGTRAQDLVGAGLSAHGPGLVLVDDGGTPLLGASPTWQDERCAPQGRWLYEQVGAVSPGLGGPFSNFPAKLRWAQENFPNVAARARFALGIKDFLVHWLTGATVTEPSSNAGGLAWDERTFAACGWPLDRLATVVGPTEVVGAIRADRARELDLPKPLPLVIGLNDGASATLATGAVSPGDTIVTLSTNGVLRVIMGAAVSTNLRLHHDLFNWPYLPPDCWIAGGQTKAGASSLQWFARIVGDGDDVRFDDLLAEAQHSDIGSGGVIFLPYLMGRGSPHGNASSTGVFAGMTLATTRGNLTRAVLEGTAFALRDIRDDFLQFGCLPRDVRLSGGGGRSALWRQIIADALAQPLTYFSNDSTLGAAMAASVGLGLHPDFRTAARMMVRHSARHDPIAANVVRYREACADFRALRDAIFPVGGGLPGQGPRLEAWR